MYMAQGAGSLSGLYKEHFGIYFSYYDYPVSYDLSYGSPRRIFDVFSGHWSPMTTQKTEGIVYVTFIVTVARLP